MASYIHPLLGYPSKIIPHSAAPEMPYRWGLNLSAHCQGTLLLTTSRPLALLIVSTISGIFFWWGANTTCTIYSTSGVFIAVADSYCSTSLLAVTDNAQTISTLPKPLSAHAITELTTVNGAKTIFTTYH
ncbi:hypothetical protein B0H14DRAFT_3132686 [Mycena olivaceomarginata]|nr:hypothetical protein B0H14DRAFT_3132686 [Mycena olivaceomarginata]